MKIEVGKYYRTRDGRKVGPMMINDGTYGGQFRFMTEDYGLTSSPAWRDDGSFHPEDKSTADPCDIVSEWTEPASPIRTRREIAPGEYGNLTIYRSSGDLRIEFSRSKHTPSELREAAHILNQIAEVLEDE